MKDLIRTIRQTMNMSQEQFAAALGTSAMSINRWENGKTIPTRMAQKQLISFCAEYRIPLAEMVVRSLEQKQYPGQSHDMQGDKDNEKLILYHGSKKGITGDIAPISRAECDFGK